jgi:hypothetical protein
MLKVHINFKTLLSPGLAGEKKKTCAPASPHAPILNNIVLPVNDPIHNDEKAVAAFHAQ